MRMSKMFIPTMREIPSDAEITSHQLMVRSGMIKRTATGIYNQLPLGMRVQNRIESIIREELENVDYQEMLCSALIPSELWQESGRWTRRGAEMFKLKDRRGREYCLGPTHEEVFTDIVRQEVSSYKQLPIRLFQIQSKYRDERKPRFGVIRTKSFTMVDAYSFDLTKEEMDKSYKEMKKVFSRILDRCGLEYITVEADSGIDGSPASIEFMIQSEIGADEIAICTECDYSANLERAHCFDRHFENEEIKPIEEVYTPDAGTIKDLEVFFGKDASGFAKTLIYEADDKRIAVIVRGDRAVNEIKVKNFIGDVESFTLATDDTVREVTGAEVGFAGPIGIKADRILVDSEVASASNMIAGANKTGYHIKNVNFKRDFDGEVGDFKTVSNGDRCPICGAPMKIRRGMEIAHIFEPGYKFSEKMNATYKAENGKTEYIHMGCYEIGTERLTAALIEQNNDDSGIVWPMSVAPFKVVVVPVNLKNEDVVHTAENIYMKLKEVIGNDVLIDDRTGSAGVKFKDSDLIGIPIRITVGRDLRDGLVEMKLRDSDERELISVSSVVEIVRDKISELR